MADDRARPLLIAEFYGAANPKLLQLLSLAGLDPIYELGVEVSVYREAFLVTLDMLRERTQELSVAQHRLEHWKRRALEAERKAR